MNELTNEFKSPESNPGFYHREKGREYMKYCTESHHGILVY